MTTNDEPIDTVPFRSSPAARSLPPAPGTSQIDAMQALAYFVGLHPTLSALDFTITRVGTIVSRVADDVTAHEAAMIVGDFGTALAAACPTAFHARRLQNGPWEWTELRARLPVHPAETDARTVPITITGRRWAVPNPHPAVGVPSPAWSGGRSEAGESRR